MDIPWCPAGCTSDFDVSDALLKACYQSIRNREGDSFSIQIPCPKCGRDILIEGQKEWDFDCWKGDNWQVPPARGRGGEA